MNWYLEKQHPCPNCQAMLYPKELKLSPVNKARWYQYEASFLYRCPKCWAFLRKAGSINKYIEADKLAGFILLLMSITLSFIHYSFVIVLFIFILAFTLYYFSQRFTYYELVDN